MEIEKKYLLWDDVVSCTKKIVQQMDERKFKPDVIIPIMRGGMYPAGLLSDLLKIKNIYPIRCSRYNGIFKAQKPVVESFNYNVRDMNVLIIDDILDTGETFEAVQIAVKKNQPKRMMSASMWVRENSVRPSFWSEVVKEKCG